jgi:hypothetical protein
MENWMIGAGIMFVTFGGAAIWGIIDTILEHRKEMAELRHKHAGERHQLEAKNAQLNETIDHMQDRLAVLETIATDPARRTADQIEALR